MTLSCRQQARDEVYRVALLSGDFGQSWEVARFLSQFRNTRERAKRELERQEARAEPALRRLLANTPTAEARLRAEGLLARLQGPTTDPEMLRPVRAVEVLEYLATRDAQQLLKEVARGAPESRLTQAAQGSLRRLAKRAAATR